MREKDLSVVVSTLEEEFNIYREMGGESEPVHCQDVSGCLQKNGKEGRGHDPVVSSTQEVMFSPLKTQKAFVSEAALGCNINSQLT